MQAGTILLIEDEADLLSAWGDILETKGYKVATATNGREALDYLERNPRPALIFLDLSMPVINGVRFLESLRSGAYPHLATVPVVVVSAVVESFNLHEFDCEAVLRKNVGIENTIVEMAAKFVVPANMSAGVTPGTQSSPAC